MSIKVSEKEIQKELREHPWANRELAKRIAQDHRTRKTTTKEGKRIYMKEYMKQKRKSKAQTLPSVSEAIGLNLPRRRGK